MSFDSRVPATLLELQKWVGAIVMRPLRDMEGDLRFPTYEESLVDEIDERITPGPFLSAAQRMGIHNQQFWFRMFTLMQERYPVLTRLFGYFDFNRKLVEPYFLKYPPDSWSLAVLGNRFPQWIEEEYKEEDHDLVYQVALVEEAHKRLLFARSLPPLKKEELPQIVNHPLFLQPSIALFELDADFFAFRLALLEKEVQEWEQTEFPRIDWSEQKRFFILFLQGEKLFYEEMTQEEHQILKAFQGGAKIEKALASLEKEVPVQQWFQKWTERGWLYRERLKNRKLDKEAPQIFWPAVGSPKTHRLWGAERGALLQAKTRSEDEKYGAKPTPAKTDCSITSGIKCKAALHSEKTSEK